MAVPDNTRPPAALPPGTRLDEFELRRVLGLGGFGIVYLAFDHALQREVAIKEYMPSSLVGRQGTGTSVSLLSEVHAEPFSLGLRSFVNEARLLARFDLPGLVKVHRYWEANGTAYMAMRYCTGSNLHAVRRRMDGPPAEAWLRGLLQPLLDALERLHREGIYHRDISPDNILLQPDGQPVLLDFGAARQVLTDKSVALTAILKPAYAPIEQYAEAGSVKQGAWTDLYALGATLHFLLLGKAPPPSTARAVDDAMQPLGSQAALLATCTPSFLQAIDWMLRPRPTDRPQSVAALRIALAPRGDMADERTVLDLSHLPPSPAGTRLGGEPGSEATVLLPRRDEPTVLIPRRDEPTVLMPRRDEPTVLMPRRAEPGPLREEPTILMPRREAADSQEVTLELPLGDGPGSRAAFDLPHEPTMRMPPPGERRPPPQAGAPQPARHMPPPQGGGAPRWLLWLAAAVVLVLACLVAWLALKPAPVAPAAVAPPAANPALPSGPAPASAAAADVPPATTAAVQSDAAPAGGVAAATAAVAALAPAVRGDNARTAAPTTAPTRQAAEPGAGKPARGPAAGPGSGGAAGALQPREPTPAPAPTPAPDPVPQPATAGGPPSLATSITRLPPAPDAAPPRAAADTARPDPGRPAATTVAAAPVLALPAAATAAAPRGVDTPVPRPAARDAEPVAMLARALSPAERCDGRSGAGGAACIDRVCRNEPALRDHADCVKARRDGASH